MPRHFQQPVSEAVQIRKTSKRITFKQISVGTQWLKHNVINSIIETYVISVRILCLARRKVIKDKNISVNFHFKYVHETQK